jgi:hypothetical protein
VFPGYVAWCDKCGWNLRPQESQLSNNIFEQFYISIGRNQSQSLLDQLIVAKSLEPSLTSSKLLAFIFSTAVHGITLAFAIVGILLPITAWPNVFAVLGGILCLGLTYILLPSKSRFPERERVRRLGRQEQSRLDATHPPTAHRMDFLEARNIPQPRSQNPARNFQEVETELVALRKGIQERALDAYRASLYQ